MINNFKKLAVVAACSLLADNASFGSDLEQRVNDLVGKMTLEEKLDLIHGQGFNMAPVPRLGLPPINMSDASMGLRITPWPKAKGLEPSTAFPASIILAATWNPDMGKKYAVAIAEEFRARNLHVLLGPGINIYRHPMCGRNYEYMGEDPYLISRMVVDYIKGVKSVGVLPVVKHLVANNTENLRKNINAVVSERALREIYFPSFKAAVQEANVSGVMNAYNLVNGEYCGESSWLLKDVLRNDWGFKGFVISDWNSIWNPDRVAVSGLDLEMPGGKAKSRKMCPAVMKELMAAGKVTEEEVNHKVRNLIRPCLELNVYDKGFHRPELNKREEHAQVALEAAREGMVLLKNKDNFLPFAPNADKKVVVIGPTAEHTPTTGGGSGGVTPENPVGMYAAIKGVYPNAELVTDEFSPKIAAAGMVVVCVGLNEDLELESYKDGKKITIEQEQDGFNTRKKDVVVEGEGRDRNRYGLNDYHNKLVNDCAKANPNIVVAYTAGASIDLKPWLSEIKALLWLGYPGANGTIAAAEILAGKVNPSGKLPFSMEKNVEDNSSHQNFNLPFRTKLTKKCGVREYEDIHYKEGIFVGYRHLDTQKIAPQYCFGHGLSYTTFGYSNISIEEKGGVEYVTYTVKNTGKRAGAEVSQLYVRDLKSSVPRPYQELKGFKKTFLKPGESKEITLALKDDAFAFWHPTTKKWTVEPGQFEIMVGSSSRDAKLSTMIQK